jgi:DnaJ like chaperone protein
MKGYYKYIFAGIGFLVTQRVWGAIGGFLLGSMLDSAGEITEETRQRYQGSNGRQQNMYAYYQQQSSVDDFATMLMALSAAVMKADGKVLKAELEYVKSFFRQQFGPQFSAQHLRTLKSFLDAESIPLEQICQDIRFRVQPQARVQLIHYLFGIAHSDNHVSSSEIKVIERISIGLGVSNSEFQGLKNMFFRDSTSDYKILGVESTATNEEIKKAYRKLAVEYHPDKVAHMGDAYQKGAQEKFQKLQEAYENVKKERGM